MNEWSGLLCRWWRREGVQVVFGRVWMKLEKDSEGELALLSLQPYELLFLPIKASTWSRFGAKLRPCVGKSGGDFADLTSSWQHRP